MVGIIRRLFLVVETRSVRLQQRREGDPANDPCWGFIVLELLVVIMIMAWLQLLVLVLSLCLF